MLSMLIRLMLAQAQECLFEKLALPGIRNQVCPLMKMAQEAAKVTFSWGKLDVPVRLCRRGSRKWSC